MQGKDINQRLVFAANEGELHQVELESIISLVWIRCPRHKWFGRKCVEMAAISAALHFCSGAKAKQRVMELCGIASGEQTVLTSEKRGIQRVKKTEKMIIRAVQNGRTSYKEGYIKDRGG